MKVLYDISILGLTYAKPNARTGVARVIENVAKHLIEKEDCHIRFCGGRNLYWVNDCIQYLKANSTFSEVPFSVPPFLHKKLAANTKRHQLIEAVVNSGNQKITQKLNSKFVIRTLWAKEKILSYCHNNNSLIHPRDITGTEIYHSTFFPVPEHIQKLKRKIKFVTSYDLIPVLYPEFTEQAMVDVIKGLLQSITPETWVLCISEATRNDLLRYLGDRVNPERVKVTELAASEMFYKNEDKEKNKVVRKKLGLGDTPYILSLCTLEPRKNIDQAIRAFAKIVEEEHIQDLNLVLVGTKGWMFDKIFDEIGANQALKDRIIVTGYVADGDLASLYSEAMMFVYPSFYEGFGLPPLEAMQCGTPVITSNTSSLPEVVGDAGIMVAPTDLDALCNAMLSIYKSPSLREELAQRSLLRATKFSWERCAEETVAAYKASLAS